MKKLLLVLIISVITLCGSCSNGDQGINHTDLNEFIGDWHMYGTFYLDLDGRIFEHPIDRVVYIRHGLLQDSLGYIYTATFFEGTLYLTRDEGFSDYDPYCGFFEGGTTMSYTFQGISPYFSQAYEGIAVGDTAVFTEHCNYTQTQIEGAVFLERLN